MPDMHDDPTGSYPGLPADALVAREQARLAPLLIDPMFDSPRHVEPPTRDATVACVTIRRVARLMGLSDVEADISRSRMHNGTTYRLAFSGTSPSLHLSQIGVEYTVGAGTNPFDGALSLLRHAVVMFARQAARRIDAERLDLDAPLHAVAGEAGHLMVDASLVRLARARRQDAPRLFRRGLHDLHSLVSQGNRRADMGTALLRHAHNHVAEHARDDVDALPTRTYGIHADFGKPGVVRGTRAIFDGTHLHLFNTPMPAETLLAALPGRRLGDLVEVDPELDDRIVATIVPSGEEEGRTAITFEPDLVPFPELAPCT
jgi:hypothetical protein